MPDDVAESFIEQEAYDEAIDRLEKVLAIKEDPGLRLRLGTCYFREGKMGDALVHARRAAEMESDHKGDAIFLVGFCLRTLKRWRESARTYEQFALDFPDSDRVRIALFSAALCLEELDDWKGAIEFYERIGGDESDFRKAICLERGGSPDEAAAVFESFVDRYGDSPEMLKVRFRLGAMRLRQGRIEDSIRHLTEAKRLGENNFIGEIAGQLLERARAKGAETARKIRGYGA